MLFLTASRPSDSYVTLPTSPSSMRPVLMLLVPDALRTRGHSGTLSSLLCASEPSNSSAGTPRSP